VKRGLALAAIAGAALVGALASGAAASRPATPAQAEFIIEAVETSPLTRRIPQRDYQVRNIRISSANARWAGARIAATPRASGRLQSVVILLKQTRPGMWRLIDLDAISCTAAPRPVLRDLFGGCIPS
jgi:hypothetical protein